MTIAAPMPRRPQSSRVRATTDAGTRITEPAVDWPDRVATTGPVVGYGAVLYREAFPDAREPQYPSASTLAELTVRRLEARAAGGNEEILIPEPLYLRRPDAVEPGPRKQVLKA